MWLAPGNTDSYQIVNEAFCRMIATCERAEALSDQQGWNG
jgi:hypothetical protein